MSVTTSEFSMLTALTIVCELCMVVESIETVIANGQSFVHKSHGIREELAVHVIGNPVTVGSRLWCARVCSKKECELMHYSAATNSCTLYDTYMSDKQPAVPGLYARSDAVDQRTCPTLIIGPFNGRFTVSGYNYGDQIIYTCDIGYTIGTGSSVRSCTGGIWSGSTPTCEVMWTMLGDIRVDNGETFGQWGLKDYCPFGTYAYAYDLKIEALLPLGQDNTAVNSIKLYCRSMDSGTSVGGTITSSAGAWGDWAGVSECAAQTFITGFMLQVQPNQGSGDDTAVNFVKIKCRDFQATSPSVENAIPPGSGPFGSYGSWSSECGASSAVCGISTGIQPYAGPGTYNDDSSLNDVIMHCCS